MSKRSEPTRSALRDAGLSALVALGLFAPIVGLRTEPGAQGLTLLARPVAVGVLVGLVFAGRLLMLGLRARRQQPRSPQPRSPHRPPSRAKLIAPLLLGLAVVLPVIAGRSTIDLGILVLTYVMLGWGLNIVVGLAGLLDLGYVAFYAVGAYAYALISTRFGLGFWTCLPLAGLLAAAFGIALGAPVLRLRGDYLAIVTLAFGEIIRIVLINWTSLTNGPNGIGGIPRPTLFGLRFDMAGGPGTVAGALGIPPSPTQRVAFLYYVILALALLTNWVTLRLRRQPLGRAWEALREDEIAARSLGINVTVTKLTAFAIGAGFAGLAGAFFATRQAFVSPESFTFTESAIVLAIVVLGGLGSQLGTALAALFMVGGVEALRSGLAQLAGALQNNIFATVAAALPSYRMLLFGLVLVGMMVVRPRGFITLRRPSVGLTRP